MSKRIVTIFPYTKNVHLTKDVGMIGCTLAKYYDYKSEIVTFKDSKGYPYLDKEVKEIEVNFLNDFWIKFKILRKLSYIIWGEGYKEKIAGCMYLIKNAKKIDVLHLFHIYESFTLCYVNIYKILNPKGVVYLKLDIGKDTYAKCVKAYSNSNSEDDKFRKKINMLMKKSEIVSAESKWIVEGLGKLLKRRILYIPNGSYEPIDYNVDIQYKEDIILMVGAIGYYKGADILLKSFKNVASQNKYKLYLIGNMENDFKEFFNNFLEENDELRNRIKHLGEIQNKELLFDYYKKSKIFVMPSKGESFGIVLVEAMSASCYIIATDTIAPIHDMLNNDCGAIVPYGNVKFLAEKLNEACQKDFLTQEMLVEIRRNYQNNFSWKSIVDNIYKEVEEIDVCNKKEKGIRFYIITRRDKNVGLCSLIMNNLGYIKFAIDKGMIPVIDLTNFELYLKHDNLKTENIWENYFEQPLGFSIEAANNSKCFKNCTGEPLPFEQRPNLSMDFFQNVNGIRDVWKAMFIKYIIINEDIMAEINNKYIEVFRSNDKVLGVLARGTDYLGTKPKMHPIQPTAEVIVKKCKEIMKLLNYDKIFLATEDKAIYRNFEEEFGEKLLVSNKEFINYNEKTLLADSFMKEKENSFVRGKNYLTSLVLLSRCNAIVAGRTNGSAVALLLSKGYEYEFFYELGLY